MAGTVAAVGPEVDAAWLGRRALAMVGLGGFAEQIVLPAAGAVPIPDRPNAPPRRRLRAELLHRSIPLEQRAGLVKGERVLVLGGGGGVGQATIAVAVGAGARVAAVASDDAKRAAALAAGAEVAFDPFGQVFGLGQDSRRRPRIGRRRGDCGSGTGSGPAPGEQAVVGLATVEPSADDLTRFVHAVRDWSGGGVDVALDPVGGPLAVTALRSLGLFGRLLVIGSHRDDPQPAGQPGAAAEPVGARRRLGCLVDGSPAGAACVAGGVAPDVEAGLLAPAIPRRAPLDGAADTLRDLVGRRVTGKVVLIP